ncbi:MAG: RNA-binding protein [Tannerella sp.]|jgi:RNA recognition motif-containing protein|nr:RNA-binding protein [Tannerella sp.]
MNIYISGLSYSVSDADLNALFAEYGEVSSAKIITDRDSGRSKGFGFVDMPNDEEGQKAIDELNGAELDEKVISVSVARPRAERPSFGGGGGRGRGNGGGGGGFRRDGGSGGGFRKEGGYKRY